MINIHQKYVRTVEPALDQDEKLSDFFDFCRVLHFIIN